MVMVPRRTLERRLIASLLPYPWSGAAPTTLRWPHNIFFSKGVSVAEILTDGWESAQSTWTHWCYILKL
uniref:Uncharacterized protein n=3 Tax=Triticum urartu TaxID=4572 RepID=A0A8R7Q254_TRIUA